MSTQKYNKTEQKLIDELYVGTDKEVVTNPFSGVSHELEPLAVALYDYIMGSSAMGVPDVKKFDTARGLFMKNWPKEYMDLLD